MFGWRKKRDGFEWQEYVRTTILLRRARRRQRLDAAKDATVRGLKDAGAAAADGIKAAGGAAASGLRQAGERGRAAGVAGIGAAASGLGRAGASSAGSLARLGAAMATTPSRLHALLRPLFVAAANGGIRHTRPLAQRLARPRLVVGLGTAGTALLLGAAIRIAIVGADITAAVLAVFGLALVCCSALPWLLNVPVDTGWTAVTGRPSRQTRQPQLGAVARMASAAALVLVAALGIGRLIAPPDSATAPAALAARSETAAPLPGRAERTSTADGRLVSGRAVVLSGDTIRVGNRRIRLSGIEAPAHGQRCARANGHSWRCDTAAKAALAKLVRRRTVSCEIGSGGEARSATGRCTVDGADIAEKLVAAGAVFAQAGFWAPYTGTESDARAAARGLWTGKAQRPAEYRAARWQEAQQAAPSGCPIKGQISGRDRVYLLPWTDGYERAVVREARGGRWFCSEEEAREAGWRPAQRS